MLRAHIIHFYSIPSSFLLALVNHTLHLFNSAPTHEDSDYCEREGGEIDTQVYPVFPLLKERALYANTCKAQDEKAQKELCSKEFPSHNKLTPGLYLVTCGCKQKVIYGFSMMLSGESPEMLFDIIMTRFEQNYNPHIIYDASCKVKEYGLSRELKRFMSIQITTDRFHEANHSTCSEAFKSSMYDSLRGVNSEAVEQTNHLLRSITSSTTFMSPKLYLRSIKLLSLIHI